MLHNEKNKAKVSLTVNFIDEEKTLIIIQLKKSSSWRKYLKKS